MTAPGKPAFPKKPGELCAMWYRENREGRRYFSGKTDGGRRVVLYIDDEKRSEKAPDARLFIYPLEKPGEDGEADRRYGPRTPEPRYEPEAYGDETLADTDEEEYE
jgi:hypothetical protein